MYARSVVQEADRVRDKRKLALPKPRCLTRAQNSRQSAALSDRNSLRLATHHRDKKKTLSSRLCHGIFIQAEFFLKVIDCFITRVVNVLK